MNESALAKELHLRTGEGHANAFTRTTADLSLFHPFSTESLMANALTISQLEDARPSDERASKTDDSKLARAQMRQTRRHTLP